MEMIKTPVIPVLLILILSCQKLPQPEMSKAKTILDSAWVEDLQESDRADFQILKDSINIVLERIENQKSKFGLRKYDYYKEQLKSLLEKAEQLIENGKENKIIEKLSKTES